MSYTRRTGNFGNKQQNTPLSSVGQRRAPGGGGGGNPFGGVQNKNYRQPGFQNKQQQQNQPQQHFQGQQAPQQQENKPKPNPLQGMQNQARQTVQAVQKQQQAQQPAPTPAPVQQQQPPPLMPPPPVVPSEPKPLMEIEAIPGLDNGSESEDGSPQQKARPFWMKKNGRINKAERAKRRNVRLRKLLQPKNALMIINELIGHVQFDMSETKSNFEDVYKAAVLVEGTEFTGFGKSKAVAKTTAAESAVRHMILNKLRITASAPPPNEEDNKDLKMEVTEENQDDVSWTHIASFAIHKLFSSWGDDANIADMMSRANSFASLPDTSSIKEGSISGLQSQPEQKPAKKLPENATTMNPIMLLNQMHPAAKYEELEKTGNPPHVQFTMKCTVINQSFVGIGSNKKSARKQAAFEACKTLLGIQYPAEIVDGAAVAPKASSSPMETQ